MKENKNSIYKTAFQASPFIIRRMHDNIIDNTTPLEILLLTELYHKDVIDQDVYNLACKKFKETKT